MKPKKSLGQHFLTSQGAIETIIDASDILSDDTVLEIGPGKGVLTTALLEAGARVIAVEKDHELIELLRETHKEAIEHGTLTLIENDVLNITLEDFITTEEEYKVVANIPYYITGQIIRKFLSVEHQPSLMTLLVQKEVARRIVAKDSKESLLSLSVKAYGNPKYIKTVKAGSFSPPPRVDSAILLIQDISREFFTNIREDVFFTLVHAGFAHKRKQLKNNLTSELENLTSKNVESLLSKAFVSPSARAEDLSLKDWQELAGIYETLG